MADIISGSMSGMMGALKGLAIAAPFFFAGIALAGVCAWIWWILQFNRRVVLFKIVGDGFSLKLDKARLIKDKNGVRFWKLKKLKIKADVPPDNCIVFSKSGETAIGYLNNMGEIVWTQPEYNPDKLEKKIVELKIKAENAKKTWLQNFYDKLKGVKPTEAQVKEAETEAQAKADELVEKELSKTETKTYEFMKTFKPISTTQRASLSYQIEQAKLEQKNDWKQHIPLIVSGIVLVMVFAIFMLFFGKVMEPIISAANVVNQGKQVDLQIVQTLERIEQRVQVLDGQSVPNQGIPIPPVNGGVVPR